MVDIDKAFVKAISENYEGKRFASLSSEIVIDKNDALFVDFSLMKVVLWGKDCEKSFLNLISVLALMRRFEAHGLIYIAENTLFESWLLIHSGKVISDIGFDGDQYSAEQGDVVLSRPFENPNFNNKECENVKILEGKIGKEFSSWLRSEIYPTSDLIDFVNNGFFTKEERQFKTTICKTNWSIGIAIAALVLSPVMTTCYSNWNGISTINSTQFDSLIQKLDTIATTREIRDIISMQKQDHIDNTSRTKSTTSYKPLNQQ